jgi:hypothetical protein
MHKHCQERARETQRVHEVLEDAGIKLDSVASDVLGVSARRMIEALIAGERDPEVLAEMAMTRMRPKIGVLREALVGRFDDHHALLLSTPPGTGQPEPCCARALFDYIEGFYNPERI